MNVAVAIALTLIVWGIKGNVGVALFVAILGTVGLLRLFKDLKRFYITSKCKSIVNGTIISVGSIGTDADTVTHEITLEFFDPEGKIRNTKSFKLFFLQAPKVGDSYQVCYNHESPQNSEVIFNTGTTWKVLAIIRFLIICGLVYYFIVNFKSFL